MAFSDDRRQWEWGESESESESNQRYREKEREKTNKIINRSTIVTVHICTVTVAIVHKCTILHPLMWVFFEPNCVKWLPFFILQNYPPVDVIALIIFEQPYGGICFSTVWKVGVLLLWIMDDICLYEGFESWLKSSTALLNIYHRPKAHSDCFAFVTCWLPILYRDKGF